VSSKRMVVDWDGRTPGLSCSWKRKRGTSGRCKQSPPGLCSALTPLCSRPMDKELLSISWLPMLPSWEQFLGRWHFGLVRAHGLQIHGEACAEIFAQRAFPEAKSWVTS
jgi:hypothetical protein